MARFQQKLSKIKVAEVDFEAAVREWGPVPLLVDFAEAINQMLIEQAETSPREQDPAFVPAVKRLKSLLDQAIAAGEEVERVWKRG